MTSELPWQKPGHGRTDRPTDTSAATCQHVDFSEDGSQRCGANADLAKVGGVTVALCEDHLAVAREERGVT